MRTTIGVKRVLDIIDREIRSNPPYGVVVTSLKDVRRTIEIWSTGLLDLMEDE